MAGDDDTRFHFDFGGITLELSGKRPFVERMYRRVMEDVEKMRRKVRAEKDSDGEVVVKPVSRPSVWVHRCSDMMRKIYMVSHEDIVASALGTAFEMKQVKNVYISKGVFQDFFPALENGQTLWAEFTPVGREKIAEATQPMREVPDLPQFKAPDEQAPQDVETKTESKPKSEMPAEPKTKPSGLKKLQQRLRAERRSKSENQPKS